MAGGRQKCCSSFLSFVLSPLNKFKANPAEHNILAPSDILIIFGEAIEQIKICLMLELFPMSKFKYLHYISFDMFD